MKLISPKYRQFQIAFHLRPGGYGKGGHRWAELVISHMINLECKTLLDYGCGEQTLWARMNELAPDFCKAIDYRPYDPCIIGLDGKPARADFVACTDVLEHVEPRFIENTLKYLSSLYIKGMFLNISMKPADKLLPDGRNSHLIVKPDQWWKSKIKNAFDRDITIKRIRNSNPDKNLNILIYRSKEQ